MIDSRFILILNFLFLLSSLVAFSYGQGSQTNDEGDYDYYKIFIDVGIPLVTIVVGVFSAKYIVGSWQSGKDISDLRKGILGDYTISFKNFVVLIDTFVLKLVMQLLKTDNENPEKPRLSSLLPWEYTLNDLKYYSQKVPEDKNLIEFGIRPRPYKKKTIVKRFNDLYDENINCYIDFDSESLNKFRAENVPQFHKRFYDIRDEVTEFSARIRQYYDKSEPLYEEFSGMWEYMIGCYVLLNKILNSKTEEEFIALVNKYNSHAEFLFDMMLNFEQKLISEKIVIEIKKRKTYSSVVRSYFRNLFWKR